MRPHWAVAKVDKIRAALERNPRSVSYDQAKHVLAAIKKWEEQS